MNNKSAQRTGYACYHFFGYFVSKPILTVAKFLPHVKNDTHPLLSSRIRVEPSFIRKELPSRICTKSRFEIADMNIIVD